MKMSKLLALALVLLISVSTLAGSTIAWFTDEVKSSGNIIKSGKLDVAMSWSEMGKANWKDASKGAIFTHQLWEPGYVDVKDIKVENNGTLAFNYELYLETSEITMPKLAEVIDVYVLDYNENGITRADLTEDKKVGTLDKLMAVDGEAAFSGILLPYGIMGSSNAELDANLKAEDVTGIKMHTIALMMQENANNDYQNLSIGNGFNLVMKATQYTYEKDSFDNQYDVGSEYYPEPVDPIVNPLPVANITVDDGKRVPLSGDFNTATGSRDLGKIYSFKTTDTVEEAREMPYAKWNADFFVSFNKELKDGYIGLAGNYGTYNWIGFDIVDGVAAGVNDLAKNEGGVRLLGTFMADNPINYEELCSGVLDFMCGPYVLDNLTPEQKEWLKDLTMTVELRLYETKRPEDTATNTSKEENGEFHTLSTITYAFADAL